MKIKNNKEINSIKIKAVKVKDDKSNFIILLLTM